MGQPARAATGQPARAATGQPARAATGQPARAATGQPARAATGQPALLAGFRPTRELRRPCCAPAGETSVDRIVSSVYIEPCCHIEPNSLRPRTPAAPLTGSSWRRHVTWLEQQQGLRPGACGRGPAAGGLRPGACGRGPAAGGLRPGAVLVLASPPRAGGRALACAACRAPAISMPAVLMCPRAFHSGATVPEPGVLQEESKPRVQRDCLASSATPAACSEAARALAWHRLVYLLAAMARVFRGVWRLTDSKSRSVVKVRELLEASLGGGQLIPRALQRTLQRTLTLQRAECDSLKVSRLEPAFTQMACQATPLLSSILSLAA
jgi:hypothetical protein